MKKILSIATFIAWFVIFNGCDKMDATYHEFVKDGPVVYIGKVDSAIVLPGRNRVMVKWLEQSDPRARTATIYWANGTKNTTVQLVPGSPTGHVIDGLDEGSYVFDIFTHDSNGNSSIGVEAVGVVYGDTYEGYRINRIVNSFTLTGEVATIVFKSLPEIDLVATEVIYTAPGGSRKTVVLDAPGDRLVIDDYAGTSFDYRTVYIPEPDAIDYFYSPYETYETP